MPGIVTVATKIGLKRASAEARDNGSSANDYAPRAYHEATTEAQLRQCRLSTRGDDYNRRDGEAM